MTEPVDRQYASRVAAEVQKRIAQQITRERMPAMFKTGLAAGSGITGVALMLKALKNSTGQPISSYSTPVETAVYRPDRPKKKRRGSRYKTAAVPSTPHPPNAADIGAKDPYRTVKLSIALGLGVPTAMIGAKRITGYLRQVARDRELRAAQREFEQSLQEYAASGGEKKQVKTAGMSERQILIRRLVANCVELSQCTKTAGMMDSLKENMLAYTILTPLLAGVYGFQRQWDKRKIKDLKLAEREMNIRREKTSPTFTVATLKESDPNFKENDDEATDSDRWSDASAIEDMDTDYL